MNERHERKHLEYLSIADASLQDRFKELEERIQNQLFETFSAELAKQFPSDIQKYTI